MDHPYIQRSALATSTRLLMLIPGVEESLQVGVSVQRALTGLNGQLFDTLLEARILLEDWRIDYNINRPHSAHDGLSPTEFVQAWLNQQQLQHA